jgi:Zn-dependent protease
LPYGLQNIVQTALTVALVIFSASWHEFGHALAAYKLGDDTAKRAGRLTPNPLAHIDPFGSVMLPLLMGIAGGPVFAFAKPVPYNPHKLRDPKRDDVLVALAGPAANILQAVVGSIPAHFCWNAAVAANGGPAYWLYLLFSTYTYVNCILAFFNLIPLPPLDGSSIIVPFLKGEALSTYYKIQHYSLPILMVLLYILPSILHFDPLGLYLDATAGNLAGLLLGW